MTYKDLLSKLPSKNEILTRAFDAITAAVNKLSIYITFWTDFQSLWDLQPEVLYERLGEDLEKWMRTLTEIKRARNSIDIPDTHHTIFPFSVDCSKVQSKVSTKYEYWQREVIQRFSILLGKILLGSMDN
jgi:dynein heavy chain 1